MVLLLFFDSLVPLWVRSNRCRSWALADLCVVPFGFFCGDTSAWFRCVGFGTVGGEQVHSFDVGLGLGLCSAY